MAEATKPSLPAVYDPNRTADGKFIKGNSASKGQINAVSKRFAELRSLWWDSGAVEDMGQVKAQLIDMAKNCPVPDVKLKAIIYYLDRTLGKPTESVEMNINSDGPSSPLVNINLSPEELALASRLVGKLSGEQLVNSAS